MVAAGESEHQLPTPPKELLADPHYLTRPRYWVAEHEIVQSLEGRWEKNWLVGWREVTGVEKMRTVICELIPKQAVNNKLLLMLPGEEPARIACLIANLNSFVLDYLARQKVASTSLNYFIFRQLAALPPNLYYDACPWEAGVSLTDWIAARVLALTYTAVDLQPLAQDLGWGGPPFIWDPTRREVLRAELDAAFFLLYDLTRDETAYVLDTFPVVRKNDVRKHGDYRTRSQVLESFDRLTLSKEGGSPYVSPLGDLPALQLSPVDERIP